MIKHPAPAIKDPDLRKIVEESGRTEITSSMVKQAKLKKWTAFIQFMSQQTTPLPQLTSQPCHLYRQSLGTLSGYNQQSGYNHLSSILGGLFGSSRCPCCGQRLP